MFSFFGEIVTLSENEKDHEKYLAVVLKLYEKASLYFSKQQNLIVYSKDKLLRTHYFK
jgi:hypothetical protein